MGEKEGMAKLARRRDEYIETRIPQSCQPMSTYVNHPPPHLGEISQEPLTDWLLKSPTQLDVLVTNIRRERPIIYEARLHLLNRLLFSPYCLSPDLDPICFVHSLCRSSTHLQPLSVIIVSREVNFCNPTAYYVCLPTNQQSVFPNSTVGCCLVLGLGGSGNPHF